MATEKFLFAENPFESVSRKSVILSVLISDFHLNALRSAPTNPTITAMAASYAPFHATLLAKYNSRGGGVGTRKGNVQTVKNMLADLDKNLVGSWEYTISQSIRPGTPGYITIFPSGLSPFRSGGQQNILQAINQLAAAVPSTPAALGTLKTTIAAFATSLGNAMGTKDSSKTAVATIADELEQARIAAMDEMYANLGRLMTAYKNQRSFIPQFFDLARMRSGKKGLFTGQVAPGTVHEVKRQKSKDGTNVRIRNTGNTELRFYRGNDKSMPAPDNAIVLAAFNETSVPVSAFGNTSWPFILVYNPDSRNTGEYVMEFGT